MRVRLADSLIANAWVLAALLSAMMGLLQFFGYTEAFRDWVHATALGDAFANLRQRNQFATLTSIGLIALFWLASQPRAIFWAGRRTAPRLLPLVFAIVLLALGNASSSSRTGMLQWCLIFALTLWWSPKGEGRMRALCTVALIAYVLAVLALPALLEVSAGAPSGGLLARFVEDPGCATRSVLWANVLHLIAQKLWLGWGWGELDYAHFITIYPDKRFCDILDNAHNLPLHLAVELGVPVALSFCLFVFWWVWRNAPWAEKHPTRQMAWAVLAVTALHSLLEYPLWYGPFQLAVGLCLLLLWRTPHFKDRSNALDGIATETPTINPARIVGFAANTVAVVCLVALAAAAWDYWRISQLYKLPADRAAAYKDNTSEKVRGTWLFQDQVQFAELTTVPLGRSNAAQHYAQAQRLLHFSPEPRVIEAAIESAVMLGRDDEALYYLQRYKAAFPAEHAAWVARSARFKAP